MNRHPAFSARLSTTALQGSIWAMAGQICLMLERTWRSIRYDQAAFRGTLP